ncbi:MAG TPA: hypothetical protein VF574_05515 [Allosphingosinicella sp.]|jgi:hypothetical protein
MTTLYSNENEGGRTTVTLELLPDGSLQLFYYDIGEDSRRTFGDSDYEAWTTVPASELPKLALALLAEKYAGRHDALSDFAGFCEAKGIAHEGGVWT